MPKAKSTSGGHKLSDDKAVAVLSYIGILCLVPLLLKKNSPFIQAHAKQGLVLAIAEFAGFFLMIIPFIGMLLWLAFFTASVYGIMQVMNGRTWEIPVIGQYAAKFKF